MAYLAVLFDLDGVLISTDAGVIALWQQVLGRRGVPASEEELRLHGVGCSAEHTLDHFLGDRSAAERAAALDDVREAESTLAFDVVDGAPDLVAALHSARLPIGVVTGASASRLDRAVAALRAESLLSARVVWGDVVNGKPAPEAFALGAERLSVAPGSCLVVEDSVGGVTAAVAAGCSCVAIASHDNAAELHDAGADAVVESLLSLTFSKTYDGGHVLSTDENDFYFPPPGSDN